ncbi:MAG: FtsK/SpoIIIE domain-containing protein [Candidatus Moraniibacteriota bacterium]
MKISFGNSENTEYRKYAEAVTLDFEKENIHFVLLVGEVGGGKSFFHRHVYKELINGKTPQEIRILFLDVPGADSERWDHSPYLYAPVETDPERALRELEALAKEIGDRRISIPGHDPVIVVHIEEDALVDFDRKRLEKCLEEILRNKKTNRVYIFYSTSRVDHELLADWSKRFVDLLVVFPLKKAEDAKFLLGETDTELRQPGEHVLLWRGGRVHCFPFSSDTQIL